MSDDDDDNYEEKPVRVWVTKYAMSTGVFVTDAVDVGDDMVRYGKNPQAYLHGEGKDWHRTEESARKRFEVMRLKAIASAKKKIAALQKWEFAVREVK